MVNAQEWLDQNYPNSTRASITELDISNKNLEGSLDFKGFTNLKKFNVSFNSINFLTWGDAVNIKEIDFSHNTISVDWGLYSPQLKKVNCSHNHLKSIDASLSPQITHFDCGVNSLTKLDLHANNNLQKLNCSHNQITNLTLPLSLASLNSFDCLEVNFDKSIVTSVSITSSVSSTETVYVNNPTLTVGLGIPLGISTFGWLILGFLFFYKRFLLRNVIPTPGS